MCNGRVTVPPRLSVCRKAKYQHERALESLINPAGDNAVHDPELEGASLIACMIECGDCDTDLDVLSTVRDFAKSRLPGACHRLVAREGATGAPAENEAPGAMAMSASGRGHRSRAAANPTACDASRGHSAGVAGWHPHERI
jgi:hypothetical protein